MGRSAAPLGAGYTVAAFGGLDCKDAPQSLPVSTASKLIEASSGIIRRRDILHKQRKLVVAGLSWNLSSRPHQAVKRRSKQVFLREPLAKVLPETLAPRESRQFAGTRGHLPKRILKIAQRLLKL